MVHAWSTYENYEVYAKGEIITGTIYYYMELTNVGDIAYRELIGRPMIRGKSVSLSAYRLIYRRIG
jgi:hypothetical protein